MADENVEPIEQGSIPVEPAATPEPQAQTPEVEQKAPEATPEPTPAVENTVPMHRFNDVYGKMKSLERQIQANAQPAPEQRVNQETEEPNWEQYEAQGKSVESFNADYIGFQVKKGIEANKAQEAETANVNNLQERQQKAGLNFQSQAQAARLSTPDFDSVLASADAQGINFSPEINLAISESPRAAELAYHVVKDPQVAYRLMSMPPNQAFMELGSIMASLPTAGNSQPDLNLTKTNPPPNPIGPGGNTNTAIDENSSILDFSSAFPE